MSLKKKGTWTLSTLPPTSRTNAPTTRALVENDSFGHILTASFLIIVQSVLACDFSETILETASGSIDLFGSNGALAGLVEGDAVVVAGGGTSRD
jgi:hypothetical protein